MLVMLHVCQQMNCRACSPDLGLSTLGFRASCSLERPMQASEPRVKDAVVIETRKVVRTDTRAKVATRAKSCSSDGAESLVLLALG
mmetsp:Transcript_31253/g.73420  ORF Transcript_31253/g.73420 Transcript_31253/m.73420 type:complete len:86 (-) Transcript_31253:36-293(-)